MPKINQEEYEILKSLDDKWKWIARDEDRGLYAFTKKPVRKDGPSSYWWDADGWDAEPYAALGLVDEIHLFQFIQWEDGEPHNIAELIEEYEFGKILLAMAEKETVLEIIPKSEETEVKKNIEWLKDILFDENVIRLFPNDIEKLHELINQLDEPETLSPEWVDEHKEIMTEFSNSGFVEQYWVNEDDLQNLLMPKQDEVDRAYKDGYEKGKEHATEKQSEETETVARVLVDYLIASAKLKLALSMEVEEMEEC